MQPNHPICKFVEERYFEKFHDRMVVNCVSLLGGGCINQAMSLTTNIGKFFLKWNSHAPADMFIREEEGLNEMRRVVRGQVLIPEPLLSAEISSMPGFLLTSYLTAGHTSNSDEMLGRQLALLHKAGSEMFGFHCNNYCGTTPQYNQWATGWLEFYTDNRLFFLIKKIEETRSWFTNDWTLTEKFIAKLPALIGNIGNPSLVHGDFWSGNYMETVDGPALIDPACSYSHREFEFGIVTLFGGFSPRFFDAYNETFPFEKGWRERNPVYQLYHLLNHFLLFGGSYKREALTIMQKFV